MLSTPQWHRLYRRPGQTMRGAQNSFLCRHITQSRTTFTNTPTRRVFPGATSLLAIVELLDTPPVQPPAWVKHRRGGGAFEDFLLS